MSARASIGSSVPRARRWLLVARLGSLLLVGACGPEMSFTLELSQCDDRLAFVQVWFVRPEGGGSRSFCRLAGPESIGPGSELDLGRFALDPGKTTVGVLAVGRSSLSSRECLCAAKADYAVSDGESYTLELSPPRFSSDCSIPYDNDC